MNAMIPHAAATLLAVALLTTASADPIIYASGNRSGGPSELIRIDVGASNVTVVGSMTVTSALAVVIHPMAGAYTVTGSGTYSPYLPKLAKLDLATGKATIIGPQIPKLMGLTYLPDGRLFGVNAMFDRSFYAVDPITGQAVRVGSLGAGGDIMDLAWHPDGTLYAIQPTALYRVDPVAGKRTLVKSLVGLSNPMGLTIDHDGTMYAADLVARSPIVRIDPATGKTTKVVQTEIDYIHGLAIPPRPMVQLTVQNAQIVVAWPAWATDYALQSAGSVGPDGSWVSVPGEPVIENDRATVNWVVSDPARFFRLVKP